MNKIHTACFAAGGGARGDGVGAPRMRAKPDSVVVAGFALGRCSVWTWSQILVIVKSFAVGESSYGFPKATPRPRFRC